MKTYAKLHTVSCKLGVQLVKLEKSIVNVDKHLVYTVVRFEEGVNVGRLESGELVKKSSFNHVGALSAIWTRCCHCRPVEALDHFLDIGHNGVSSFLGVILTNSSECASFGRE